MTRFCGRLIILDTQTRAWPQTLWQMCISVSHHEHTDITSKFPDKVYAYSITCHIQRIVKVVWLNADGALFDQCYCPWASHVKDILDLDSSSGWVTEQGLMNCWSVRNTLSKCHRSCWYLLVYSVTLAVTRLSPDLWTFLRKSLRDKKGLCLSDKHNICCRLTLLWTQNLHISYTSVIKAMAAVLNRQVHDSEGVCCKP